MFGAVIAFKDYKYDLGILGSKWVGFKNFEFFFQSSDAWRITRNTVGYGMTFIILGIISAVIVALLLFEIKNKLALKFYQTSMILPHFVSWVIIGFISYSLLNPVSGILNQILKTLNLAPIEWYSEPKYWPFILTLFNIWKGVGMGSVVYYAALMGVDHHLYEAAEIDGATKMQQTWHISIPALIPVMTILSIMSFGNIFRGDFGLFYQLSRDVGTLYPTTDILDTFVYRGLRTGDLGATAAVGFFQSFVGLVMVLFVNGVVKKIKSENSLF
jgi:putative aldouronate transport system permease protein